MKLFLTLIVIAVVAVPVPVSRAASGSCDVLMVIDQLRGELASRSLYVGNKDYSYTEIRAGNTKKTRHDPEMEIVLALLNLDTCATQTVTVTRRGAELIVPEGYEIEAIRRGNGIQWNDWNTEYRITKPSSWFLIGNLYPRTTDETISQLVRAASGKFIRKSVTRQAVKPVFYTPATAALRTPEFIAGAHRYQKSLSFGVDQYLRERGVFSHAYPDVFVPDVSLVPSAYTERLLPVEHMDLTEFVLDPEWAADRAHMLIAANRDYFGIYTCSPAKACGPRQWTKGTWHTIDKKYPNAGLPDDYLTGARDAFWSAVATRLLHDNNLAFLKKTMSPADYAAVIGNPHRLEEALDAMYNTDPRRVVAALKAYLAHPGRYADWIDAKGRGLKGKLLAETKGYIVKLRYLRDQWPLRDRNN